MRRTPAPPLLTGLTTVIVTLLLLPLLYLIIRAAGIGPRALLVLPFQPETIEVAARSLLLALIVVALSLLLALPLAWLTTRTDLPRPRFWTIITTLPLVIPGYIGALALIALLGPRGIVQGWLEPLGVERLPPLYGLPGAAGALTLFTYPYLLLMLRAGLLAMDPALEEAARSLGRTSAQTFLRVTLPALRPALAAGSLLVALYVLADFGVVSLMRYPSFTRVIYLQYRSSFDRSHAAALALLLVVLTLALLAAAQRLQGRRRHDRAGMGSVRPLRRVALGVWRLPAQLFCAAVALVAFAAPAGVLVYWLVRGLAAGESLLPLARASWNSGQAAILAAVAAVATALPVAYLSVRSPTPWSRTAGRLAYVGYGLPGIVVALSLVHAGATWAPALYQTLGLLIFAYVVRFLSEALGALRTTLYAVSPRLEEAARSLGLSQGATVRRVTLPLLRGGLWAGAALVFLSVIKELPATLLLGPTGYPTLAAQVWAAAEEASFARAAAPALMLLAISALTLAFALRREQGTP